ncbi:hypothetical protein N7468_008595 [Penicillium chermesinum]|uniref:WD40 repeat-like protein n=1 Tax=Penicillium chermesinum TaxID=63820 RepID=A0A9W9NQI0_9EURO|nr:uncharacterized protein N7468_008595 [Penicillium chermesinum]KAJ5224053.1 hypothetical protein N7468_008595 [Penicillium chermesinum]
MPFLSSDDSGSSHDGALPPSYPLPLEDRERGRSTIKQICPIPRPRSNFRSPASPDRFIPQRRGSPSTPFRVNKLPQQLSPQEKLFRQRSPNEDPFLPTPPSTPEPASRHSTYTRLPIRPRPRPRPVLGTGSNDFLRRISAGSVWGVGGNAAITGGSSAAGTNGPHAGGRSSMAPNYIARFLPRRTKEDDVKKHESRIALAMDIDPTTRLLGTCSPGLRKSPPSPLSPAYERFAPFVWKGCAWKKLEREHYRREIVPPKPFRILDAPFMRDDFYCSTLAYSFTSGILAVGLGQCVYLWSEGYIVERPPFGDVHPSNYVTSLAFSSDNGGRSILAVGRHSGQLSLWSVSEDKVRFEISHPNSISCVVFKSNTSRRPSEGFFNVEIEAEDLVVGDERGTVWYYSVEWHPVQNQWSWSGCMTLLAKIHAHSQQICGLAWSPDEQFLATGGNDNACMLFELRSILGRPPSQSSSSAASDLPGVPRVGTFPYLSPDRQTQRPVSRQGIVSNFLPSWAQTLSGRAATISPLLNEAGCLISGGDKTILIPFNRQKYRLAHSAAVKAIAFAPWQPSLLATGGGSNDQCIHFFHTKTGICLATINVFAQVTSLIWSQSRREIAATFGYAQPEHPFRIAVFSWPSCAQVAVIPWGPHGVTWDGSDHGLNLDCGRALWAVSYPGRPPRPLKASRRDPRFGYGTPPSPTSPASPADEERVRARSRLPRVVRPKEKEGGMWCSRTMEEGCIIVASSDQTVKFHEVWTGRRKSIGPSCGLLGGSDILECMEGIEKCGNEVIPSINCRSIPPHQPHPPLQDFQVLAPKSYIRPFWARPFDPASGASPSIQYPAWHPMMRLSILLLIVASTLATTEYLNITTLAARNNRSTLECWALEPGFKTSTESGTAGSKSLNLGPIGGSSNSTYGVIPANFNGGRHNAPTAQYAYVAGGKNGAILALDTADVSKLGHITTYPSSENTVSFEIPLGAEGVPAHRVLYQGPCKGAELS